MRDKPRTDEDGYIVVGEKKETDPKGIKCAKCGNTLPYDTNGSIACYNASCPVKEYLTQAKWDQVDFRRERYV